MSWAGRLGGLEDPRASYFFDLVCCLNCWQERQVYPPFYILENVQAAFPSRGRGNSHARLWSLCHHPSPVFHNDQPPFVCLNVIWQPCRVLPSLVSFPRSHAFRPRSDGRPGAGEVWNTERGQWEELERAMGFVQG